MASLKRLLVGSPIRTARLAHERLTKKTALAIFASDALSSTAYATEQILLVLAAAYVAGAGAAFGRVIPISIAISLKRIADVMEAWAAGSFNYSRGEQGQ